MLSLNKCEIKTLLTATLRTHKQLGCVNRDITLRCPAGTTVVIESAEYATVTLKKNTDLCNNYSTLNEIRTQQNSLDSLKCNWPDNVQIAVETCRMKQRCNFKATPRSYDADPCPMLQAYAQIQYKCRPSSFNSKVSCENERIQFSCEPNNRLAIFSASYGRTEYQSIQCPQPQGVAEETCLLSYATETVMKYCHGKKNCTLTSDSRTFHNPCHPKSRVYLKVIYACVPRRVLLEEYEEPQTKDEYTLLEELDEDYTGHRVVDNPESLAPSPNIVNIARNNNTNISMKFPPASNPYNSTKPDTREKVYIYIGGSISGILISLFLFAIVAFVWRRKSSKSGNKYKDSGGDNNMPNAFIEEISEVEADIALAVSMPPITVIPSPTQHLSPILSEVVRYGKEGITPRSLCQNDDSQYYYG